MVNMETSQVESANPQKSKDWRRRREERKLLKRKWKEETLIKNLEQEKQQKVEEAAEKLKEAEAEVNKRLKGCTHTVAIALPGSILDNAQTPELRAYLAGQIARAAVIFNVTEIVIFDESGSSSTTTGGSYSGIGKRGGANIQMARILQYLECPQYLRKAFFPQHQDLQNASLLNPLNTPHHMKIEDEAPYREGVVLDKPVKDGQGSFVNAGLYRDIQIDKRIKPGIRVTVQLDSGYMQKINNRKKVIGRVVAPSAPYSESGIYWGYTVRLASSLGAVFTESPHPGGYDLLVGTSENGDSVDNFKPEKFRNLLVVFGGVKGLEYSLDADQQLNIDDPSLLFQHYLNTCPNQGSGTIRTEEAILVTLSAMRPMLQDAQR